MKGIRFLKANPKVIMKSQFDLVGEHLWFPDFLKSALVNNIAHKHPDQLVDLEVIEPTVPRYNGEELHGKHLGVARTGGAGDIIMIGASLQKLKKLYPTCEITFMTDAKYAQVAEAVTAVDGVATYPVREEVHTTFDYWTDFVGSIEAPSWDARNIHGIDLFAGLMSVKLNDDEKLPHLSVPFEAQKRADARLKSIGCEGKNLIAVQFRATNVNRCFDQEKMINIIAGLAAKTEDAHIIIMGGKRTVMDKDNNKTKERDCPIDFFTNIGGKKMKHPQIHNLTGQTDWLESMAILSKCKLALGPDSSIVHIAGSMKIPCLGIYGPFPARIRTTYYPECETIESNYKCAPCFSHGSMPCSHMDRKRMVAPCWEEITADMIIDKAQSMYTKGQT